MDGGGRIAGPLRAPPPGRAAAPGLAKLPNPVSPSRRTQPMREPAPASRTALFLRRLTVRLSSSRIGRRGATLLALAVIGGFTAYGVVLGGHVEEAEEFLVDLGDVAGTMAGFKVKQVNLSGQNHVTPPEILAAAGIKPTTSLPFVDADATRARLEYMPWIASATVRKFYPDRIDIAVVEREAYALWQFNGQLQVIARDGMPIAPYSDDPRYLSLPIVVGEGADKRVGEIVEALARVPPIRDQVRAAILVADRRWTLKLRNGIDVRLPEEGFSDALMELADLDREKKILTRDVTIVDLRLPDRVAVRLSDSAYEARMQVIRAKAKAKKGGAA